MKLKHLFATAFVILISAASVKADNIDNKNAEATILNFYRNLQKKDFTSAIKLCSEKAFETNTKAEWNKALLKNAILLGAMKSFTRNSEINIPANATAGTIVAVGYNLVWQYGKSNDSVYLIKEKDGSMKVYSYIWEYKDAKYLAETVESENMTNTYMNFVMAGNYDAAIKFCSEESFKVTSKASWKVFFDKAIETYGPITGYKVITDSSYYNIDTDGDLGRGNYYDIYVQTKRSGEAVTEKIVFFQKNYLEPVKLIGHFFQ